MIGVLMNKKDVRIVAPDTLNSTVKHNYANSDFGVSNASKHLFGKHHITELIDGGTGSCCGSPKIIAYDNYLNNQDTVNPSSNKLRITGLINCLQRFAITSMLNMSSMMRHTFIKMAA